MMKIFDTHAHYTDKRFTDEIDGGVDALLAEVFFFLEIAIIPHLP